MMHVLDYFASLKIDESWTYEELKPSQINYLTHSYHRYPAKFIPQLVSRLIREYSKEGALICDPFVGGGTTLVEGLVSGRRVIGVDVNPVAILISKAKTTCIAPKLLERETSKFFHRLDFTRKMRKKCIDKKIKSSLNYNKIRYWFDLKAIKDLSMIFSLIGNVKNENIQLFLKCGFSHILKSCSKWNGNSIKPVKDENKKMPNVIQTFKSHINHMAKKNAQIYQVLPECVRRSPSKYVRVVQGDCRFLPCEDDEISVIGTSPPYVTSYDYLSLHQLTMAWLEQETEMDKIRENFLGTNRSKHISVRAIQSEIGERIVEEFRNKDGCRGQARAVATYFVEMQQALEEFYRVLEPKGKVCMVIGDTALKGVDVLSAEVLTEIAINRGFHLVRVIKRRVPHNGKFLPSVRDTQTGCFAPKRTGKKKCAYAHEYILVLSKL